MEERTDLNSGERSYDRRSFLGAAAATTVGLTSIGSLGAAAVAQAAGSVKEGSKGVIGVNQPDSANPVIAEYYRGAQAEAKKLGYTLLQSTAALSATKQLAEIETWIGEKVNAMTILPLNLNSMAPLLKKAKQAGIPYAGYILHLPGESGYVAWDNTKGAQGIGTTAGNWVNKTLGGKAEVALLTADNLGAIGYRVHWAGADLRKVAPGAKIVAHQDAIVAPDAFKVVQSMLQANPNINVIIAMSDDGAVGAQQAFMGTHPSTERQAQMFIAGFDGGAQALKYILGNGSVIRADAALPVYNIGQASVWVPVNMVTKKGPTTSISTPVLVTHQTQAVGKKLVAAAG